MNDNRKLAFNTIALYIKLVFSIIISFVTSRLILDALGASDYGLYYVVGGFVAILNIIATSMIATSYRYIAIEIGKGQEGNVNKTYNTILVIHLLLAILILLLGETIGLYYIDNYLKVEVGKLSDAKFVLHLSLLTSAFSVITIPINGLIIANEKFLFSSIIEIGTSLLKLILIILLTYFIGNKLRLYAVILALVQFLTPLSYQIYSYIRYKNIINWNFNKRIADYKEIISFTFWMLIGTVAVVGNTHGSAIILNFFFGTILNASFGLATQISNATSMFTSTLRQAAVPQIMKSHSGGDNLRSLSLVYAISRISFFLMLLIALPILLRLSDILKIWLKAPPKHTDTFILFLIISGLISSLGSGFDASIQSTGKVKKNQIGYSLINLSLLPIMYLLYKLGYPPYMNVIFMAVLSFITLFFQSYIMAELTTFNVNTYLKMTILPCVKTTIISLIPLCVLSSILGHSLIEVIIFLVISFVWIIFSIYYVGAREVEKVFIKDLLISNFIKKHIK